MYKCEKCGKLVMKKYGSGRFCSVKCANSRDQLKGNKKAGELSHQRKMKRFVKAKNGQILDITNQQLEDYKKTHLVCEICGQVERASHNKKKVSKLCRDHDHNTCKFRGLLCSNCNRKLGWFENYKEEILKYLDK